MIEKFKKLYEKNINKVYNEKDCNEVIRKWNVFRLKILNDTFTLDDYINKVSNTRDYLVHFLEIDSSFFGSSKVKYANHYMIKINNDSETFCLEKNGDYTEETAADRSTA